MAISGMVSGRSRFYPAGDRAVASVAGEDDRLKYRAMASGSPGTTSRRDRGALAGAAFLMATSAIGPGFLTQTAVFTERHGRDFAFAILASVLLALVVQLNVWRVLAAAGRRAPELASAVVPGLGPALAAAVFLGGLVFNVGNVAGCGLGLSVFGVPGTAGAAG
jgi:Mn2+/Fe2+ NRAMP family transporter